MKITSIVRALVEKGASGETILAAVEAAEAEQAASRSHRIVERGTRLKADWVLPKSWGDEAVEFGLTATEVRIEAGKFRDHWTSKTGKDATKLDWRATWRNWCRTALDRSRSRRPSYGAAVPPVAARGDADADWSARVAVWGRMGRQPSGWSPSWGPMPGQPGCRCPVEYLQDTHVRVRW